MSYWLKVIFFTITPLVLLYFISIPYYDSSDDADTDFKKSLFYAAIFLVPVALGALHLFLARDKRPGEFPVKAIFVLLAFSLFVESLNGMYQDSFRLSAYAPSLETFVLECLSIGLCAVLLIAVQVYLVLRNSQ